MADDYFENGSYTVGPFLMRGSLHACSTNLYYFAFILTKLNLCNPHHGVCNKYVSNFNLYHDNKFDWNPSSILIHVGRAADSLQVHYSQCRQVLLSAVEQCSSFPSRDLMNELSVSRQPVSD